MPSSNPHLTFGDIIENIDRILHYTAGMTEQSFSSDPKTIDATERCLSRISEAAVKLGSDADRHAPDLPWNDIRGLGNHLRHAYRGVRLSDVWKIVSKELEPLRKGCALACEKLAPSEE